MHATETLALLPILLISVTVIAVMLGIAVRRNHAITAAMTLAGLAAAFAAVCAVAPVAPLQVTALLLIDRYALFNQGVVIASAVAVSLLSYRYFEKQEGQREEFYLLLLLSTLGCVVLVASSHFASFLLGLEVLSVSLYAMLAYFKKRGQALEAGVKYLILASASAAFLLFGMALIYAATGNLSFFRNGESLNGLSLALVIPGIALTVTGLGFKLGVVPFHLWTPDVYQGAPAPAAAFLATTSKTAVAALLVRYLPAGSAQFPPVHLVLSVIAIASMCAGNFLALRQSNIKRILAYSSIAHFGYVIVAFLAGSALGSGAVSFYLAAYTVTTLTAFGVVTVLSTSAGDADSLEVYRGLFWRRPLLASALTIAFLSLAGIPATMGFLGKFYILAAGANASAWPLMIVLVVTSVAGLFYYLRIVVTLYSAVPEQPGALQRVYWESGFVLAALSALVIWFGVYPDPILNLIQATVHAIN